MTRRLLQGVALAGKAGAFDLELREGRVGAIAPAVSGGAPRWLALPSFANLHAHANRAFSAPLMRPASLEDAVASARKERLLTSSEQIHARSLRFFQHSIRHGVSSIRTHTDVDGVTGLRAIDGVRTAAEQVASSLDVEIVAFASAAADPSNPETQALFAAAVRCGARLIGAVPALSDHPPEALDALLDAARALDIAVDVHLDEHLDAPAALVERLVEGTVGRGLQGRVTLSHGCVLSALDRDAARRLLDRMAAARIGLVVLPELNLYLQARGDGSPRLRGLAPVADALRAGVDVRFGTDNVRDWFFPFGDADMLETAYVGAMATHVDDAEALSSLVCGGRSRIEVGDVADLVLLPCASFDDALARRPSGRILLRRGQPAGGASGDAVLVDAAD